MHFYWGVECPTCGEIIALRYIGPDRGEQEFTAVSFSDPLDILVFAANVEKTLHHHCKFPFQQAAVVAASNLVDEIMGRLTLNTHRRYAPISEPLNADKSETALED